MVGIPKVMFRCTVFLPYRLWTADDAFDYVLPDLLSIILVDVERKNHLSLRGLPILPILAHHVLQVDGRYTHTHKMSQAHVNG